MTTTREHEWFTYGRLNWECCRVCGIVRRKEGKNSPCKGPVSVGPRQQPVIYASEDEARADWLTIAPKHRTKERLAEMLKQVRPQH